MSSPELELSLERQIIESPDDAGLRQVYADLLAERGDERGLFIRVQCALAEQPQGPRRDELLAAERDLLARHWQTWAGAARAAPGQLKFVRGFVEAWACTPPDFLAAAHTVAASAPLRKLALFPAHRPQLLQVVHHPVFAQLREIELHGLWHSAFATLARVPLPLLQRLELEGELDVNGLDETPDQCAAKLPALRRLEVRQQVAVELLLAFTRGAPKLEKVVLSPAHALAAPVLARLRAHFGERLTAESW
ncbi:MAG: TIGR02996 domain-containing protein [Archangiaceae bacterium]|nr:TIGR02996 domain-containing protein [Archangiaceae bacterium]